MTKRRKIADWWSSEQVHDGVPYWPNRFEECCDCGLVHKVKFETLGPDEKPIKNARVRITAWRHETATKHARKLRKKL